MPVAFTQEDFLVTTIFQLESRNRFFVLFFLSAALVRASFHSKSYFAL